VVGTETLIMSAFPPDAAARRNGHAPVLQLAGILDRAMCEELIQAHGRASFAGTAIQVRDGEHVPVVDIRYKNRRDHRVVGALQGEVWRRLCARAWPLAQQAFHFEITRFEYIHVGRYSGDERGHFVSHRDNSSPITAHRRFALSLNLNDDYEGGELLFPEYTSGAYRPDAGSGVVFSCSLVHAAAPVTRGDRYVLVAMLGGEDDLAVYEAARGIRRPADPARLVEDARRLREVAGDVVACGDGLDPNVVARLDRVHRELERLQAELRAARPRVLERQAAVRDAQGAIGLKVHLGCGDHRIAGWVNVDARGGDIRMDLRWPLPFRDGSVSYVFASHVFEHLYRGTELRAVLREVRRVLSPGGVLRIVVPDMEKCLRAYVAADDRFFADRARTWPWAAACRTHLDHFLAYAGAAQALEDLDGHKYGYDFQSLSVAVREAGFRTVVRSEFMASTHPELRVDHASHDAPAATGGTQYSLFVEAS
jgi:predicted 2-oxoglutarate/Fe(II)-dependent dioxygenase YbiX/SAM-dependent methyltransferase